MTTENSVRVPVAAIERLRRALKMYDEHRTTMQSLSSSVGDFLNDLLAAPAGPHEEDCAIAVNARHGCTCATPKPEPAPAGATDEEMYPCADCGKLRTAAEGGTTFAVCDECWDKHYSKDTPKPDQGAGLPELVAEGLDYFEKSGDAGDKKYVAAIRTALARQQPQDGWKGLYEAQVLLTDLAQRRAERMINLARQQSRGGGSCNGETRRGSAR